MNNSSLGWLKSKWRNGDFPAIGVSPWRSDLHVGCLLWFLISSRKKQKKSHGRHTDFNLNWSRAKAESTRVHVNPNFESSKSKLQKTRDSEDQISELQSFLALKHVSLFEFKLKIKHLGFHFNTLPKHPEGYVPNQITFLGCSILSSWTYLLTVESNKDWRNRRRQRERRRRRGIIVGSRPRRPSPPNSE